MTVPEKRRLIRLLTAAALLAAVAAAALLFKDKLPLPNCLFYELTGLRCPGCGNTRAAAALLRLHIKESLAYNYAYPAEFLYLLWVLAAASKRYVKNGRFSYYPKYPAADHTLLALLLAWWVARNILKI